MKGVGDNYDFSYSLDGNNFVLLGNTVSGDILSTNVAGGFTGCLIGLHATSANDIRVNNLKDAYADYFTIGCAVNMANFNSSQQIALITSNFNSITAENDMKPQPTQPAEENGTGKMPIRLLTSHVPIRLDFGDIAWFGMLRPEIGCSMMKKVI